MRFPATITATPIGGQGLRFKTPCLVPVVLAFSFPFPWNLQAGYALGALVVQAWAAKFQPAFPFVLATHTLSGFVSSQSVTALGGLVRFAGLAGSFFVWHRFTPLFATLCDYTSVAIGGQYAH